MGILPILLTCTWVINLESQSSRIQASPQLAGPLEGKPGLAKEAAEGQCGGRPREQAVWVGSCLFSWSTAFSASSNSAPHMLFFLPSPSDQAPKSRFYFSPQTHRPTGSDLPSPSD